MSGGKKLNKPAARAIKLVLLTAAGAAAGYLYYRLVGCRTGACPLTSHPVRSALFGAATGFVAGWI